MAYQNAGRLRVALGLGLVAAAALLPRAAGAQQCTAGPGFISTPATGAGVTILDPDGNRCSSATTAGFVTSDVTESELPFIAIPISAAREPTGDVNPSGGQSDLVDTAAGGQMVFVFYDDRGTVAPADDLLLFRIRIGKDITGAFGYSILVDTDMAYGTGVDANAVAGNLGFEAELRVATGGSSGVFIDDVDGTTTGTNVATYALADHTQRSIALTTDSGDADIFFDFYIPFQDFATAFGVTAATPLRFVAATAKSPGSALGGSAADIGGVDDNTLPDDDTALGAAVVAVPPTPPEDLGPGGSFPAPCTDNTSCGGSTPICDTSTGVCVACLVNADCSVATTPLCSAAHTCVACAGDYGSATSPECPVDAPLCTGTGACIRCASAADCAGHGGPVCDPVTGGCVAGCNTDADCAATEWCAQSACTPKLANGQPLPGVAPINATCTEENGARVCLSGVCDPTNDTCGLTNGKTCGPPPSNAVCQSGLCLAADDRCGEVNGGGCAGADVCRSGICFTDSLCGLPNGEPCEANGSCRTVCVEADGRCGLLNGSPCASAAECRSGVCNADGHCGDPNGTGCTDAATCRSGYCFEGACATSCAADTDCAADHYCSGTVCVPDLPNGAACDRVAQCQADVCFTDGRCGLPAGETCADPATCRDGACHAFVCATACTIDADCPTLTYCDGDACVPALPNDEACARDAQCLAGICFTDGRCGLPAGLPCGTAAECRGGICDLTFTCVTVGCTADSQCARGSFCDATTHLCVAAHPNGEACDRPLQCVSVVCETDDRCGEPVGGPCGSSLVCRSGVCLETGVCGACSADADCGGATSGRVCGSDGECAAGCRGTGGNGCPAGMTCTSVGQEIGACVPAQDGGVPPADGGPQVDAGPPADAGGQLGFAGGGLGCAVGAGAPAGAGLLGVLWALGLALRGRGRRGGGAQ